MAAKTAKKKSLNLALQGGGAHGAFTWGVLDRLLEEERLEIDGISGTSAGAMNAAVLAEGYCKGGREGARAALGDFWERVGHLGSLNPLQGGPIDWMNDVWKIDPAPSDLLFDTISRVLSPYQFNPLNWNPLRTLLEDAIDFKTLAGYDGIKLFISATNVRSGKNRVFEHAELSADVLLASACLPFLFQAVEIDGEPYWDGGYMGNPAIYPLIYNCASRDIAIVQINPLTRDELPRTAPEILDRINEISFNSTLVREMRAIAFVSRLIDEQALDSTKYKRLNIHIVEAEDEMDDLGVASKMNARPDFLQRLHRIGRGAAERWLAESFDAVGERSSIDIVDRFL